MLKTQNFQAYHPISNSSIIIKLNQNQIDVKKSNIKIEYQQGQSYSLQILYNDLSTQMKFVMGNINGLYTYLSKIFEQKKFGFCQFNGDTLKIIYLINLPLGQKVISQNFKSKKINVSSLNLKQIQENFMTKNIFKLEIAKFKNQNNNRFNQIMKQQKQYSINMNVNLPNRIRQQSQRNKSQNKRVQKVIRDTVKNINQKLQRVMIRVKQLQQKNQQLQNNIESKRISKNFKTPKINGKNIIQRSSQSQSSSKSPNLGNNAFNIIKSERKSKNINNNILKNKTKIITKQVKPNLRIKQSIPRQYRSFRLNNLQKYKIVDSKQPEKLNLKNKQQNKNLKSNVKNKNKNIALNNKSQQIYPLTRVYNSRNRRGQNKLQPKNKTQSFILETPQKSDINCIKNQNQKIIKQIQVKNIQKEKYNQNEKIKSKNMEMDVQQNSKSKQRLASKIKSSQKQKNNNQNNINQRKNDNRKDSKQSFQKIEIKKNHIYNNQKLKRIKQLEQLYKTSINIIQKTSNNINDQKMKTNAQNRNNSLQNKQDQINKSSINNKVKNLLNTQIGSMNNSNNLKIRLQNVEYQNKKENINIINQQKKKEKVQTIKQNQFVTLQKNNQNVYRNKRKNQPKQIIDVDQIEILPRINNIHNIQQEIKQQQYSYQIKQKRKEKEKEKGKLIHQKQQNNSKSFNPYRINGKFASKNTKSIQNVDNDYTVMLDENQERNKQFSYQKYKGSSNFQRIQQQKIQIGLNAKPLQFNTLNFFDQQNDKNNQMDKILDKMKLKIIKNFQTNNQNDKILAENQNLNNVKELHNKKQKNNYKEKKEQRDKNKNKMISKQEQQQLKDQNLKDTNLLNQNQQIMSAQMEFSQTQRININKLYFLKDVQPLTNLKFLEHKVPYLINTPSNFIYEQQGQLGTKITKRSQKLRNKLSYLSLYGQATFPSTGRYYLSIKILKSSNYHICIGLMSEPIKITQNEIALNCDAIYLLDGSIHDQISLNDKKNNSSWRVKQGQPLNVYNMELMLQNSNLYIIMIVDMDKQQTQFYWNQNFIAKINFSSYCKGKNKDKLHPYIAIRNDHDQILIK